MRLATMLAVLSGVGLLALAVPEVRAGKKAVKLTQQWKGSVADENLRKGAPEVITNQKAMQKLWLEWKMEHKLPEVDFHKEIVLVTTSVGSRVNLAVQMDDKGDLRVLGFGTRDIRPGFRYVLGTVSREGIKTVNGKPLPSQ